MNIKSIIPGFFAVLFIFLNGGCSGVHQDPAPVIRPQEGADLCDEVCAKMQDELKNEDGTVGCEIAKPLPVQENPTIPCEEGGPIACISCTEWCIEQHNNGIYWNNQCILTEIEFCTEVETMCNIQ
jgi:hypothetical protein